MTTRVASFRGAGRCAVFYPSLVFATALLCMLSQAVSSAAQTVVVINAGMHTNSLSGKVVDPSGSAIPGVRVERIAAQSKKVIDSAVSNNEGKFELKPVEDGNYTLRLTRAGFRTMIHRIIVLKKYKTNLTLTMSVGL